MSESEAALYEAPFGYLSERVKPFRQGNREKASREFWFRHWNPRPAMWRALGAVAVSRYIATPTRRQAPAVRLAATLANLSRPCQLIVIARDDDTTFGILHSRFHEILVAPAGNEPGRPSALHAEHDLRHVPVPGRPDVRACRPRATWPTPRAIAIAEASRRLVELRDRWLNPPEWVEWVDEPVPGYPRRPVPGDEDAAKALRKRTLTNLYNARPQWLADAHAALDAVVAAAYGWSADITDDDSLRALLGLNVDR